MQPASDAVPATAKPANITLVSRAERILLPGLFMGIAGDYLLREGPHGIGLFLWLALLAGCALWLARGAGPARLRLLAALSGAALCAALVTVLRGLDALIPTMLLAIVLCAVMTALATSGIALRTARVRDYFVTGFAFPLQLLTLTPRLLQHADLSAVTRNPRIPGIVRGIVLALPVLLIFGALFAAADAGFSLYLSALTDVISPRTLQHLLLVLIFGWLATSLLGIACRKEEASMPTTPTAPIAIGATEMHVVLALVSALFAAFVLLQLGYLFGGTELIENTSGLTVAEHARRGFFELVVVAALTLAFLFGISATDCEPRILRRYGTVLIACVLVILVSALQRLFLYTDAFGMTIDRFSALAAILWLVFNLLAFAATVLRGDVRGFASGIAISGITCLLLLGLVNPAGMVARINLERSFERGAALDVDYLLGLGADAVPLVLERFDELPASAQCSLAIHAGNTYPDLFGRPLRPQDLEWRYWNAARANERAALRERLPQLAPLYAGYRRDVEAGLITTDCR